MNYNQNILVTGAAGFIGSYLCEELIRKKYNVFGVTLSEPKKNQIIKGLLKEEKFHLYNGNICESNFLQEIIKNNNIRTVFHLAARMPHDNDLNNPFPLLDVNTKGTLNLLNLAYRNGIDKFIYVSTMSVYSEPPEYLPVDENHPTKPATVYGASKLGGELFCKIYSEVIKITILRYGGAYGEGQDEHYAVHRFVARALENKPITIYGSGNQTSDFTYVKDIIQGTILAMEKNIPGTYNIASGKETSIKELAQEIISLINSKSKIILADKKTDRPFKFFLSIKKAQEKFGYFPSSLKKGLSKYISEFNREIS